MSKSSFSFHCMICFEEFHPDDRYPVVLPCGHTYVCHVCAKRLDKCMECRTPLFYNMPTKAEPVTASQNYTAGRSSWASARTRGASTTSARNYQSANAMPPAPPVKKRLPLPKNVVLLSLIEATELATEDANRSDIPSLKGSSSADNGVHSSSSFTQPFTDEEEEERIKIGTSIAVSDAGTYAVALSRGLAIFPSRPGSLVKSKKEPQKVGEDVDALVRDFHIDNKIEVEAPPKTYSEKRTKEELPAHLRCGDRVQVVAIEAGGWAKLARGYGYVRADGNQLVKVGNCVDRACRLEAMIRSISIQRKRLRMEQNKVDNLFIKLMNDLQISLISDEDLTVIVADAFANESSQFEERREESSAHQERYNSSSRLGNCPNKPIAVQEKLIVGKRARASINGLPTNGGKEENRDQPRVSVPSHRNGVDVLVKNGADIGDIFAARSQPSPSVMRAGARAWRELHGRDASQKIDFRTGMSGHMALLSPTAHPHEFLNTTQRAPVTNTRGLMRMSNHTGLTMSKSKAGIFALLNIPTLSSPPRSGTSK